MKKFKQELQNQFDKLTSTGKLFRSNISGQDLWEMYLNSFENDPVYRDPESSSHNCQLCNNFLRRYGNIIALDENMDIMTMWDFIPSEQEYIDVNKNLHKAITNSGIKDIFYETYDELNSLPYEKVTKRQEVYALGVKSNVKTYSKSEAEAYPEAGISEGERVEFHHLSLDLPKEFVKTGPESIESIQAKYRSNFEVFKRGMDEISIDTLNLVKDLINQGSLLDGNTHLDKIDKMIVLSEQYKDVPEKYKEAWCWLNSYHLPEAKFRNTLIGVLCVELTEGMELNKACENWNKRVDPANYMKATAPITKRQIEEAKIFVEDNGYTSSFERRPATIDDIHASEILHMNSEGGIPKGKIHLFEGVTPTKSTRHKKSEFNGVEEIPIEKFMSDILPGCTSIEAFVKSSYENHMVTLTTASSKSSKPIFKWDNNFSWTFNGNLAGKSMIKSAVKSLGGKVDGVLRFSIMWAEDNSDNSDLDAHCKETPGEHIYYRHPVSSVTDGNLDIDIVDPRNHRRLKNKDVVENITYPKLPGKDMTFSFQVHNFSNRNSRGFKAEIEFDGEIYQYEYNKPLRDGEFVKVAVVSFKKGEFSIKHIIEPSDGYGVEKEFYGIKSNKFHKVNLACLSPNHWGENTVGNKYYFFMLEGAKSGKMIRSFHNENLKGDLVAHRKVMEVLANTTMVESSEKELSGLGFNSTVRDELILKLTGSHKRIVKVKF